MNRNLFFGFIKKSTALLLAGTMALSPLMVCASDDNPPPQDVKSGALIQSSVYGEVVITKRPDGGTDYTFFEEGRPSVQRILASMRAGEKLDYTKMIQSTATNFQRLTSYRGDYIENDLRYTTGSTVENRGSFSTGAQYGSGLSSKNLTELQTWVADITLNNNTGSMTDYQKVKFAHDYLVKTCAPAPNDNKNHRGNAWGSVVYHEANARGYARGMKALLDAMGVGCYVANATSDSALTDYSWNVVRLGEYWYIIDAYADDSQKTKGCFLISDNTYKGMGMRWDEKVVPGARYNYK